MFYYIQYYNILAYRFQNSIMTFNMATVTIKFLTIHQAILTSNMISRVGSKTDRKYVNDIWVSTR